MYYRCTNKSTPMSDWGHAMMAESYDDVYFYGKNVYTYNGDGAVYIMDLEPVIRQAWIHSQATGDFGLMTDDYYRRLTPDEVVESFNPDDIVNSAAGYDCELVFWLSSKVLEPVGINAILTINGAVVFEESLLTLQEEV